MSENNFEEIRQISRDVRRMYGVACINLGMAMYSAIRTLGSFSFSTNQSTDTYIKAEGIHDIGDTAVYFARAITFARDPKAEDYNKNFKKVTYSVVSLLAGGLLVKSGIDVIDHIKHFSVEDYFSLEALEARAYRAADSAIFAGGNGAGYQLATAVESETPIAHQMKHHSKTDWRASWVAALANAGGIVVPFASEAGGLYMAGFTAIEMNPLAKHNHEH